MQNLGFAPDASLMEFYPLYPYSDPVMDTHYDMTAMSGESFPPNHRQ